MQKTLIFQQLRRLIIYIMQQIRGDRFEALGTLAKTNRIRTKLDPTPRKTARAFTGEGNGEQHFHSHRKEFVYGL